MSACRIPGKIQKHCMAYLSKLQGSWTCCVCHPAQLLHSVGSCTKGSNVCLEQTVPFAAVFPAVYGPCIQWAGSGERARAQKNGGWALALVLALFGALASASDCNQHGLAPPSFRYASVTLRVHSVTLYWTHERCNGPFAIVAISKDAIRPDTLCDAADDAGK